MDATRAAAVAAVLLLYTNIKHESKVLNHLNELQDEERDK